MILKKKYLMFICILTITLDISITLCSRFTSNDLKQRTNQIVQNKNIGVNIHFTGDPVDIKLTQVSE